MKSSYKIALLIAAGLLVIVLAFYLMQDGDDAGPTADVTSLESDPAAQDISRPAPSAAPGSRTADAGSTPRSTPRPTSTTSRSAGDDDTSNPLLAELRASLAAAQNEDGDASPSPTDVTAPQRQNDTPAAASPQDERQASTVPDRVPPAAAASPTSSDDEEEVAAPARANDSLTLDDSPTDAPGASAADTGTPVDAGTAGSTPSTSSPTTSATPAPADATASDSASTRTAAIGPTPGRPYFGPLPEESQPTPSAVRTSGASARAAAGASRPATGASSTAAGSSGTYTIRAGDTFASIASSVYQDERRWVDIAQANPTVDPTRLRVGQEIRLPGAGTGTGARGTADASGARQADPAEVASGRDGRRVSYVIRPNDSLSTIAQQFYGSPAQWRVIFEANREALGNDPNRIRAGQEIIIPPAPRGAE